MSLVSHSSSAFSAVAEAQSVLRELRDRVNRANVETNRNQQEAAALEKRAKKLSKEVFDASTECISLEQECARQAKILDEIPDRLNRPMKNTDKLLDTWKQLDDQLAQLSLTERDVEKEQQVRRRYFSDQVEVVERELFRFRDWHLAEMARHQVMLNEADFQTAQLTRQKNELEEKICDKEKEIKQSKSDLTEAKQNELQWVHKLRIAQEQVEMQKIAPLIHASLDALAVQIAEELKAIEVQKKIVEDEFAAVATACETLSENETKIEEELLQLKLQVQQKEQELLARKGSSTARTLALEHEVAQLTKEIAFSEAASAKVIQTVDDKAAKLAAELNAHISSERKTLCEDEERLKADLELLCSRMGQEEERWKKKILDKKLSEANFSAASISRTATGGKASKDQVHAKQIAKRRFLGGESISSDLNGKQKLPSKKKPSIPSESSSGDSFSHSDSPLAFQMKKTSKVAAVEQPMQETRMSSVNENTIRTFSRRSSTINEAANLKHPSLAASHRPSTSSNPLHKNDSKTKSQHQPADNNILKVREQKSVPSRLDMREQPPPQKKSLPQAPMFAPSRGLTIADVIEEDQNRSGGKGSKKPGHHRQIDPFRFRSSISSNYNDGNRDVGATLNPLVVSQDKHGKENAKVHNRKKSVEHKTKKSKMATGEDQSSGSQFDLFN